MRMRMGWIVGLVLALGLAGPGTAGASTTLGTTTQPASSTANSCNSTAVIAQYTSDPTTQYMVPPGGGPITSWSINTTGDTPGAPVTFVVLRPIGGDSYTVVGSDSETIPNPLPVDNIATYSLAAPITVTGGETLGLYAGPSVNCYWKGGSTPAGDSLMALDSTSPPTAGEELAKNDTSPGGYTMDLSATLGPNVQDAGVSTSAGPANSAVGHPALLSSTVSNGGPGGAPIMFTDQVPAGLKIDEVSAGEAVCTASGQKVTCTTQSMAPGQSVPVIILVTPTAAGSYTNQVSVASFGTDPNPANNSASARLHVLPVLVAARCIVPSLKGTPLKVAKHLLRLLNCKPGRVRHVHSSTIPKGDVIRTSPRPGRYVRGRRVAIRVSSGPSGGGS